jgi:hypothetical protein
LCHETKRWKSDVPLTEGQLRSKRDEFWDTAPAFDGRKEIWDALRAAAVAAEAVDFELAQAILDGANISVPNGKGIHWWLCLFCSSFKYVELLITHFSILLIFVLQLYYSNIVVNS